MIAALHQLHASTLLSGLAALTTTIVLAALLAARALVININALDDLLE